MTKDQLISAIAEQTQRKSHADEKIAELSAELGRLNSGFEVGDRISWTVKTWKSELHKTGEVLSIKGRPRNRYDIQVRVLKKDGTPSKVVQRISDWDDPKRVED